MEEKLTAAEKFETKLLETENARLRQELGNVLADPSFLPLLREQSSKTIDSTKVQPSFSLDTSLTSYNDLPSRNKSMSESIISGGTLESNTFSTTPQRFYNHKSTQEVSMTSPTTHKPLMTSTVTRKLNFTDYSAEMTSSVDTDRLIGEIAFQLDRRMLQHIFADRRRLYGFTVRNIDDKILECSLDDQDQVDTKKREELKYRRDQLMQLLRDETGYDSTFHPTFSELLVNKFGILKSNRSKAILEDTAYLSKVMMEKVDTAYASDVWILLRSLAFMSSKDGKSMFQ